VKCICIKLTELCNMNGLLFFLMYNKYKYEECMRVLYDSKFIFTSTYGTLKKVILDVNGINSMRVLFIYLILGHKIHDC